jgi:formate dehydrogenase iron-sulfur subunit
MLACPFDIPTFTWDEGLFGGGTKIQKCNLCIDRVSNGLEPACVKTCPSGALMFGTREEMVALGEERLANNPERYYKDQGIYGLNDAGGTTVLYISHIPFDKMGLPVVRDESIPEVTETIMKSTPIVAVSWAGILAGLWWVFRRRNAMTSVKSADNAGKED